MTADQLQQRIESLTSALPQLAAEDEMAARDVLRAVERCEFPRWGHGATPSDEALERFITARKRHRETQARLGECHQAIADLRRAAELLAA